MHDVLYIIGGAVYMIAGIAAVEWLIKGIRAEQDARYQRNVTAYLPPYLPIDDYTADLIFHLDYLVNQDLCDEDAEWLAMVTLFETEENGTHRIFGEDDDAVKEILRLIAVSDLLPALTLSPADHLRLAALEDALLPYLWQWQAAFNRTCAMLDEAF